MRTADLCMSQAQASAELAKYAGADTVEDRLIAGAYRALKRGKRLLELYDSFRLAGVDELGRPKLALARADWAACWFSYCNNDKFATFAAKGHNWGRQKRPIRIPAVCMPGLKAPPVGVVLEAPIPTIPPKYRPKNLRGYHILWEAAWKEIPIDPLLLKHMGGTLYIVLAAWDLTPVERAVLRGER